MTFITDATNAHWTKRFISTRFSKDRVIELARHTERFYGGKVVVKTGDGEVVYETADPTAIGEWAEDRAKRLAS